MTLHVFDQALALTAQPGGDFVGTPSPAYWNMVGPYGGITAATMVNAILLHPQRLGDPLALTINYASAVGAGPVRVVARPVRTNRSTQHWVLELWQAGSDGTEDMVTTGTAMTSVRRATWSLDELPMPAVPPPEAVEQVHMFAQVEWVQRYEMRPVAGAIPTVWDGGGSNSLTQLWVRDAEPRPLDFLSLASMSDTFYPRIWLRRALPVPVGTVTLTIYFHADSAQLAATGTGFLLAQAQAQGFRNGFYDQTAQLWNEEGRLLVTTHQLAYYKE
ncbi:MAG: thioesterase family protein [Pseudomonadota bacterium]